MASSCKTPQTACSHTTTVVIRSDVHACAAVFASPCLQMQQRFHGVGRRVDRCGEESAGKL
jgi:hypothetical protein